MADINYDINYGAIPPACISGGYGSDTITLDYTSQPSVVLNSTMSSGLSPTPYTYTTTTTGSGITYNPLNVYNGNLTIGGNGSNNVHIDADGLTMKQGADIKIGGKSLCEAIEKIEERLGILKPNPELESRWDQLRELRNQYIEMERDLLEKEKLMKILKEA
jgi:hypothetical protein